MNFGSHKTLYFLFAKEPLPYFVFARRNCFSGVGMIPLEKRATMKTGNGTKFFKPETERIATKDIPQCVLVDIKADEWGMSEWVYTILFFDGHVNQKSSRNMTDKWFRTWENLWEHVEWRLESPVMSRCWGFWSRTYHLQIISARDGGPADVYLYLEDEGRVIKH